MQFAHTWQQILNGQKTQTRRLIIDSQWLTGPSPDGWAIVMQTADNSRMEREVWQVGKTYAVQPGRGKAAVGRIRITAIQPERLQDITEADARAEGCLPTPSNQAIGGMLPYKSARYWFADLWNEVHPKAPDNWESNPDVWVITFELVTQ